MRQFSRGGCVIGRTVHKFGMEDHIYPGEVLGYIWFGYPNPQGQGAKSGSGDQCGPTVHFCANFIKQILKGIPENGQDRSGQIRSQTSARCTVVQKELPRHGTQTVSAETLQADGDPPREGYSLC